MGLIARVVELIFGGSRNVLKETAEVFRENSEGASVRASQYQASALTQFSGEFLPGSRGAFDRFMDGVNRLPRPMMALGCLGLFVMAMVDPDGFALRMQGIALVPEPLWWLLGVVVSFYFGARHQAKGQAFQQQMADSLARIQTVSQPQKQAKPQTGDNPALRDWQREVAM